MKGYIHPDWDLIFASLVFPGFGYGGINPSEFETLTLDQLNALLKQRNLLAKDSEDEEIEEGHEPIPALLLQNLNPKQLAKELRRQKGIE